jgi:hypothetical protein
LLRSRDNGGISKDRCAVPTDIRKRRPSHAPHSFVGPQLLPPRAAAGLRSPRAQPTAHARDPFQRCPPHSGLPDCARPCPPRMSSKSGGWLTESPARLLGRANVIGGTERSFVIVAPLGGGAGVAGAGVVAPRWQERGFWISWMPSTSSIPPLQLHPVRLHCADCHHGGGVSLGRGTLV